MDKIEEIAIVFDPHREDQCYVEVLLKNCVELTTEYEQQSFKAGKPDMEELEWLWRACTRFSEEFCSHFPQYARSHLQFLMEMEKEKNDGIANITPYKNFITLHHNLLIMSKPFFFFADTESFWFRQMPKNDFIEMLGEMKDAVRTLPLRREGEPPSP